ncbi:MAG: alpha/beta hydrolase [Burkholderiales bacterium]|nr:alpha/beta hydrolase [Burkholderiales bacterium]
MAVRAGSGGERTLEQVKSEILRRAGRDSPLEHITPEDAQAAVAALGSLDRDHWAAVWCDIGLRHESRGDVLRLEGHDGEAAAAYFLAYANCRTGRYPVASTPGKQEAYRHSLRCFHKAARYFDPPLQVVVFPFDGLRLKGYLQLPSGGGRPPVVIHWGGVDGWKEDRQRNSRILHRQGLATFTMDMPGTGENPVGYMTPDAERTFSAAIDHLRTRGDVDGGRIGVWGGSFGGYWAAKLAHVEAARIAAAVVQGGNVHHGFQRAWLEPALTRTASTYLLGPASLLDARSWVLGAGSLGEVRHGAAAVAEGHGAARRPLRAAAGGQRQTRRPGTDRRRLSAAGARQAEVGARVSGRRPHGPHAGHEGKRHRRTDRAMARADAAALIRRRPAAGRCACVIGRTAADFPGRATESVSCVRGG